MCHQVSSSSSPNHSDILSIVFHCWSIAEKWSNPSVTPSPSWICRNQWGKTSLQLACDQMKSDIPEKMRRWAQRFLVHLRFISLIQFDCRSDVDQYSSPQPSMSNLSFIRSLDNGIFIWQWIHLSSRRRCGRVTNEFHQWNVLHSHFSTMVKHRPARCRYSISLWEVFFIVLVELFSATFVRFDQEWSNDFLSFDIESSAGIDVSSSQQTSSISYCPIHPQMTSFSTNNVSVVDERPPSALTPSFLRYFFFCSGDLFSPCEQSPSIDIERSVVHLHRHCLCRCVDVNMTRNQVRIDRSVKNSNKWWNQSNGKIDDDRQMSFSPLRLSNVMIDFRFSFSLPQNSRCAYRWRPLSSLLFFSPVSVLWRRRKIFYRFRYVEFVLDLLDLIFDLFLPVLTTNSDSECVIANWIFEK